MVEFELKDVINTSVKSSTDGGVDYITVTGTPVVGVVGIPYNDGNEKYLGFINDRNVVSSTSLKSESGTTIDNAFLAAAVGKEEFEGHLVKFGWLVTGALNILGKNHSIDAYKKELLKQ